jgi:hypothetical protein
MPIQQKYETEEAIGLEEFFAYITDNIDTRDTNSLLSLGERFTMLGNNRSFLSDYFADYIKKHIDGNSLSVPFAQSIELVRCKDFFIRANFWLPEEEMTDEELHLFAYHQAHDHNFDLLSLAYCGDGYTSDGYTYNYQKVAGYIGEVVELDPQGAHKHAYGDVLLYECNKDIHFQRPPSEPSITLNVIPLVNQNSLLDQYFFQIDHINSKTGILQKYGDNIMEKRKNLFNITKHIANEEIAQIFIDIAKSHPCNRTRYEALIALETFSKDIHDSICYFLRDDSTPILKHYVRKILNP